MTVTAAYRYGIDWRRKGLLCWEAITSDALNLIPSPLTWEKVGYSTTGALGTAITIPLLSYDFGARFVRWITGSAATAYFTFAGSVSNIPVQESTAHVASIYICAQSATTVMLALQALDQDNNVLATSSDFGITTTYQKFSLSFTTGAGDTGVKLRVLRQTVGNASVNMSGFMVTAGVIAPTGFNTGQTIDLYDNVTPYVQTAKWKLGFNQPFNDMADESTCDFTLLNEN